MNAVILLDAESDIEQSFNYYESQQSGLGHRFVDSYRKGLERICRFPNAWSPMDNVYRRYRLRGFPYGIMYRVDAIQAQIVVVAVAHLSREPGWWRQRGRA